MLDEILGKATSSSSSFELHPSVLEEVHRQKQEYYYQETVLALQAALTSGAAGEDLGKSDLSQIEVSRIQEALERATAISQPTVELEKLMVTNKLILAIRKAEKASDGMAMRKALNQAMNSIELIHPCALTEILWFKNEIENLDAKTKMEQALLSFHRPIPATQKRRYSATNAREVDVDIETIDVEELKAAIVWAEGLEKLRPQGQILLGTVRRICELRDAMRGGNWSHVQKVLKQVEKETLHEIAAPEINMIRFQMKIREVIIGLQDVLREGAVECCRARFHTNSGTTQPLMDEIQRLSKCLDDDTNQFYTRITLQARKQVESLLIESKLVLAMRKALKSEDFKGAYQMVSGMGLKRSKTLGTKEIETYEGELKCKLRYDFLCKQMTKATHEHNDHQLETYVKVAFQEEMMTSADNYHKRCLSQAVHIIKKIRKARELLKSVHEKSLSNLGALEKAFLQAIESNIQNADMVSRACMVVVT